MSRLTMDPSDNLLIMTVFITLLLIIAVFITYLLIIY